MALRMGLLGKKIGMTQRFNSKGEFTSICAVQAGPCIVLDIKTVDRDGYSAIQLGFDTKPDRLTKKPAIGIFSKANTAPRRFIREIRLTPEEIAQFQVGQILNVDQVFSPGDIIDVIGTSKGKGFQGVMKKHHFSGFRGSHGTHEYFRHGGSIGCRLTPGRVHKGKRMPGHMGNHRTTVQNITVVDIDAEKNIIMLKGGVPGAPLDYLMIRLASKRKPMPFSLRVPRIPETAPEPSENPVAE
jgi:large subunit ribosomal protein L3